MKQTVEEAAMQELMSSYAIVTEGELVYQRQAMLNMFKKGAEWRAKQSPWISVNQYPPMDKPLLLKYGDGGIDDMDLGFYTGLHYLTKDGQEVDKHVIECMVL